MAVTGRQTRFEWNRGFSFQHQRKFRKVLTAFGKEKRTNTILQIKTADALTRPAGVGIDHETEPG